MKLRPCAYVSYFSSLSMSIQVALLLTVPTLTEVCHDHRIY
uniref:Uncharacterized protein n=1 Tax=Arundo donax TaxID=35708 RepID=A0A0A9DTM9_ARUDO